MCLHCGGRARDILVLPPWKSATGGPGRNALVGRGPALPLISHGAQDFLEQDYYRDLEDSSWGRMGGWLIFPAGSWEGFCRSPRPPPTN